MSQKNINIGAIEEAASQISQINNQLMDTLNTSRTTVQSLSSVWSGRACEATISAFNAFETKYFQLYRDMLEQYSSFLKNTAAEQWSAVENRGTKNADLI